ncbi:MAG: ABC transporter ATP-binding protein [Gammaproteobacteria bacterium]|nr:ABC transporter ATP-binding protein [Gammaproteobacteria bacterium]
MAELLRVEGLSKRFGDVEAVRGIGFAVREGICFGLLGPNGAGKTTTLEILEGLTKADSGRILYRGEERGRDFLKRIGIQFQNTAMQDFLTVRENLKLFSAFYEQTLPIDQLVGLCALGEFLDRDARKLSGGQRQRLLLAMALVNDPELLFLDEPTTGLDPQARRNFWQLVRGIKARGKTVILTTHYMDEAEMLCDEIAVMDHGRIIAQDAPHKLLAEHFDGVLVRLPANGQAPDLPFPIEKRGDYYEFTSRDLDASLRALLDADLSLTGMQIQKPNLEDLFIKLTGHQLRG